MDTSEEDLITHWNVEKLRSYKKEYSGYTDEEALNLIDTLDRFARILLQVVIKENSHEQRDTLQKLRKGNR